MSDDRTHELQEVLERVHAHHLRNKAGVLPDYIPQLAKVNPDTFGLAMVTAGGEVFCAGDVDAEFTIQSVSKPFALGLALEAKGPDGVYARVGTEPTGNAFNAIVFDQRSNRPFNPMVNAGAIAITSLLYETYGDEALPILLDGFSRLAGRPLEVDERVYRSEASTGHRNIALAQ